MTIFFAVLAVVCLVSLRPVKSGLNGTFLSIENTTCVKGVFVLLVFLSHVNNYFTQSEAYSSSPLNSAYVFIQSHLGQAIVVMFLFYSGYGVAQSIAKKGENYVRAMPRHRILKTLVNFDIAVVVFIIMDIALGTTSDFSIPKILLSFIGWDSVGNSNWYIFAVLLLYIFTYVSFSLFRGNVKKSIWVVTAFTVVYIVVMSFFKDPWWFDTVILYPLGMWFSLGKDKITAFFEKKKILYYIFFAVSLIILAFTTVFFDNIVCYEIFMIVFCAAVVLFTLKFNFKSPILSFFGKHLFEVYIFMRVPMIILEHFGVDNILVFAPVSFVVTILLSIVFHKLYSFLSSKLFA